MTKMTEIEKLANKFDNDVELVKQELRRVQSTKCRLKKQKNKKGYDKEMTEVVKYEQVLKEARQLLEPKKKPVTHFVQEDVDKLTYEETVKALRSIQSKKVLSQFITEDIKDNVEYQSACKIEEMLKEHRKEVREVDEDLVRKTDIKTIIDTVENNKQLSKEKMLEMLNSLL